MNSSAIWSRPANAWRRRAARWLTRRPFTIPAGGALVSFTFDDFPRSAFLVGGAILEDFGFRGTYYASLGLAGSDSEGGELFHPADLTALLLRGHELGCHTFDHCPSWSTQPARFEASVIRNATELASHSPSARFRTLSYPIDYPRPETKLRVSQRFACCRGGGQTFNTRTVDLNYLASFFLEQSRDRYDVIQNTLEANNTSGGWLIFSTHEVSENPTRFGCTPTFFRRVVECVAASGVQVLPVFEALKQLKARAAHES